MMGGKKKFSKAELSTMWKVNQNYFRQHLKALPTAYGFNFDTSRMTILYFSLSALDTMGAVDEVLKKLRLTRQNYIDWIYAQQVLPDQKTTNMDRCGFRGSPHMGVPFDPEYSRVSDHTEYPMDEGHIAQTYVSLCCLLILGDDLSKVNKKGIIGALRGLQKKDGRFSPTLRGSESDMRFLFCACAISAILNDWSGFDLDLAVEYIKNSQSWDGGIALFPGSEGHGGSTFCAISSLTLMNRLNELPDLAGLVKWCIRNQGNGFKGRTNKPEDTCYSFWLGATLTMLGAYDWTNREGNRQFNYRCWHRRGGFSKLPSPDMFADILHAHYGVNGLSLIGEPGLKPLNVSLGLTQEAVSRLKHSLPSSWPLAIGNISKPQLKSHSSPSSLNLLQRLIDSIKK